MEGFFFVSHAHLHVQIPLKTTYLDLSVVLVYYVVGVG